ncbi:EAL domain-containing protein, partial [Aquabacterium sp.]|uniref:putative bifunctional diguanylate cyclase/phosphodiesterase n=1 Tax=Aquabacterium sp. TaxID=1872578 RepID=UPI0035B0DB9A
AQQSTEIEWADPQGRQHVCQARFIPEIDSRGLVEGVLVVARDITEHRHAEEWLRKREHEFRVLVDHTPDTVARYDRDCRRTYVNATLARLANSTPDALLGHKPSDYLDNTQSRAYEAALREAFATGEEREFLYGWQTAAGEPATIQMRIVPERDSAGNVVSVLAVGRDITALEATQRRLEDAQRIAKVCHWEWDYATNQSSVSATGREALGLIGYDSLSFEQFLMLIPLDQRTGVANGFHDALKQRLPEIRFEHSLQLPDGTVSEVHNWVRFEYDANGRAKRALGVTQDVTSIKTLQRQTHQLAFYDPLTELPNRALLHDRLKHAITEAARRGTSVGLVLLDVDGFQKINDSLGHASGDALLKIVAERLAQALRDYDTVARLGGDEFAIIAPQIRQASDLSVVAARIKKVFELPIPLNGNELVITVSAGAAMYPPDGADVDELMAHADAAMNHAKVQGRDNVQFYSRELTDSALERLKTETDLRKGIERDELELFYQPKIDLGSGQIMGAEALMRWRHPERGLVPPDRFIPVAEDTGLIIEMGKWALRTACLAAVEWNSGTSPAPLKIAVNLSPRQFYQGDLVKTVLDSLQETGCAPAWIELEITEGLLLNDHSDIRKTLGQLHDAGLSIAIDDFGTGYSALSYLTRFPIDTLKIDRSFVRDLTTNPDSAALAQAIVTLGYALRMELVAEGVETEAQRDHLAKWGCQMAQGYLFGKPTPAAEFVALLATWDPQGARTANP